MAMSESEPSHGHRRLGCSRWRRWRQESSLDEHIATGKGTGSGLEESQTHQEKGKGKKGEGKERKKGKGQGTSKGKKGEVLEWAREEKETELDDGFDGGLQERWGRRRRHRRKWNRQHDSEAQKRREEYESGARERPEIRPKEMAEGTQTFRRMKELQKEIAAAREKLNEEREKLQKKEAERQAVIQKKLEEVQEMQQKQLEL